MPRRVLDRKPLRHRIGPDVNRLHVDWQVEPHGELAAELLVACGLGSQLVIDMATADYAEAAIFGQFAEHERQGHGIGSARQANKHTAPGRTQYVSSNRSANLLQDRTQLRAEVYPVQGDV